MAKRSSTPKVDIEDSAVQAILAALLADFTARGLTAEDLRVGYEGPPPADLREQCCAVAEFSDVDYDLAFKSLTDAELVNTGPTKMYDNPPSSGVMIFAWYSENKFSYLTETGYQRASRLRTIKPRAAAAAAQNVHISGGTFNNSLIGVGPGVKQTLNVNTATSDQLIERLRQEVRQVIVDDARQQAVLDKLDALQAAHDKPTKIERYMQVMGVLGDHITVLSFLLTPLLLALQH